MEEVNFKLAIFSTCLHYNIRYREAIKRGQIDTPLGERLFGAYRAFDDFIKAHKLDDEFQAFIAEKKAKK